MGGSGYLGKIPKKCRFFFDKPPQSDNFDPRSSAHGPSESLCSKFSETHVETISIFEIVGASPLLSQVIRKSCRPKCCLKHFLRENALSRPNRPFVAPYCYTYSES